MLSRLVAHRRQFNRAFRFRVFGDSFRRSRRRGLASYARAAGIRACGGVFRRLYFNSRRRRFVDSSGASGRIARFGSGGGRRFRRAARSRAFVFARSRHVGARIRKDIFLATIDPAAVSRRGRARDIRAIPADSRLGRGHPVRAAGGLHSAWQLQRQKHFRQFARVVRAAARSMVARRRRGGCRQPSSRCARRRICASKRRIL